MKIDLRGVVSRTSSSLHNAVTTATIETLAAALPEACTVVVPTSAHRVSLLRAWVEQRPGDALPEIQTMPSFVRGLAAQLLPPDVFTMGDAEADLILGLAVADSGESFRPAGLTVARIVRWKQELQTVDRVVHEFQDEERPADLFDIDRVLRVWTAYEARKGRKHVDRGDVSILVADGLAQADDQVVVDLVQTPVFVASTHGLSHVDRTILHLLARHGCDIGVQFAHHLEPSNRSASDAIWLVGHGWEEVDGKRELNPHIVFAEHSDRRDEVRHALAYLKEKVNNGIDPDHVCLLVPGDGSYDETVLDVANTASVPVTLEPLQSLATGETATTLLAAGEVVANNWDREDVTRFASSGSINIPEPLSRFVQAADTFRIMGGDGWGGWQRRIQDTQSALESVSADDDDREVREKLQVLSDARRVLDVLGTFLDVKSESILATDFAMWLDSLVAPGLGMVITEDLRESLDTYVAIATRHDLGAMSLSKHLRHWWKVVASMTVKGGLSRGGLQVLRGNEARLSNYDAVACVGFYSGVLPRRNDDPLDKAIIPDVREEIDAELLSDMISCVSENGELRVSRPTLVDQDPSVASPYEEMLRERFMTAINKTESRRLLLSRADMLAFRSGESLNGGVRQQGATVADLSQTAIEKSSEITSVRLSPSRVDRMSSCPYRYFAQDVLQIRDVGSVDETLSPLEYGSLMHDVAHAFFEALRGSASTKLNSIDDIQHLQVSLVAEDIEAHLQLLGRIFDEQRAKHPGGYLYDAAEQQFFADDGQRAGMLRRWLTKEIDQQTKSGFKPILFELEIELPVELVPDRTDAVKLRIDRIDAKVDEAGVHVRVIDYKTTTVPSMNKIMQGEHAQMPMYLVVLHKWFADRGIPVNVDSAFYHTFGRAVHNTDHPKVSKPVSWGDVEPILELVRPSIEGLRRGVFPVDPLKGACRTCHVRELCRVDQWGMVEDNEVHGEA